MSEPGAGVQTQTQTQAQSEEIEALGSIYCELWKTEDVGSFSFDMNENGRELTVYFYLPPNYPAEEPPTFEMMAPALTLHEKDFINDELNKIYLENIGEPILFQWIEKIREILQSLPPVCENKKAERAFEIDVRFRPDEEYLSRCPTIHHGEIIEDRKSTFQAHVARVKNMDEIKMVLNVLKSEKKVAEATHNITAWICGAHRDCDDDGEKAAGGRLLRLLSLSNVQNTIVVVSRWYGGKLLGPDRFRHINNAAKQALIRAGVLDH